MIRRIFGVKPVLICKGPFERQLCDLQREWELVWFSFLLTRSVVL